MTRQMQIFHPFFTQDDSGLFTGAGGKQYRYVVQGEADYPKQWKNAFISQDGTYALAEFDTPQLNGDAWGCCEASGEVMHGLPVYYTLGILGWDYQCNKFERLTGESVCGDYPECAKPNIALALSASQDVSGTHFASFAESAITGAVAGGVTAALYEHSKEKSPMCETRQQAIETNCSCAWHDRQIEQTVDPGLQFMARATGWLAIAAVVGALVVLTGGLIAVFAGVTGALYMAYKLRRVALTVVLATLSLVAFPLRFFGGMVADGIAELKQEKAQSAPQPAMLSDGYRVVEPLLLSDNLQPDSIEFDSVEPEFVNVPGRKANKAAMKMEAK